MRNILVLLTLSSLMLVACQPAVPGEEAGTATVAAALSDDDLAAHDALTDKLKQAFLELDWDLLASCYTDDAVLMPANMPEIVGKEDLKAFFSQFPPLKECTMTNVEVVGSGDYAYVKGTVHMVMEMHFAGVAEGVAEYEENGKFLEIRKRQADGSWLITHDMYSSDAAFGSE